MGRIVAIVNQKGGVGKTTTSVNLGRALAIAERPVLLIDADPQANSTRALGVDEDAERASLYDAISGSASLSDVRLTVPGLPHLDLVPGDRDLIGAEIELNGVEGREFRLKSLLSGPPRGIPTRVDRLPSLARSVDAERADRGGFRADSRSVRVPGARRDLPADRDARADPTGAESGARDRRRRDDDVRRAHEPLAASRRRGPRVFGDLVYTTVVPRNIRLGEAPSHGKPIFLYDIRSRGAEAYLSLAKEFVEHETKGAGQRA